MASFGGILAWWLLSALLSALAWPLSYRLFRWLPDRGLGFSRLVGWLFTGYLAWLIGFAHNSALSSLLTWAGLGLLSWKLFRDSRAEQLGFLKANGGLLFVYELAFFALLFLWSLVRMKHPDIVDQEKFMDFAFFNSILRSPSLHPADPWLAGPGNHISYYYFGYFLNAAFARLSFVGPDIAYNLAVSHNFALCGVAMLSLGYNLTRALWPGLAGLLALQVFGNLHGALQVLGIQWSQGFNWWEPTRLIKDVVKDGRYLNRWWWSASPGSLAEAGLPAGGAHDSLISEFPVFSFLHGDLHPHFTGLPLLLLVLALGLNLARNPQPRPLQAPAAGRAWSASAEALLALALALGAVFMGNTWDLPAAGLLVSLLLAAQLHAAGSLGGRRWLAAWLLPSALLLLGLLLLAAPFLGLLPGMPSHGPGLHGARTGLRDTLVFWGFFLAALLPWGLLLLADLRRGGTAAAGAAPKEAERLCPRCGGKLRPGKAICGTCGQAWESPAAEAASLAPPAWTRGAVPALLLAAAALALLLLAGPSAALFGSLALGGAWILLGRGAGREGLYAAALVLVASLAVLFAEFVYLRDGFTGDPNSAGALRRMNTVFKFYFQAWVLLAAALPFALHWTLRRLAAAPALRWAYLGLLALLGAGALVYPAQAISAVWQEYDSRRGYYEPTLDGANWFRNRYPADFAAVERLRRLPGQPVILEAVGGPYSHYARVSAYTGFPTVVGWANHESQWRKQWPAQAEAEANEIYATPDPQRARQLLDKYGVELVFVGQLEREKYGPGVDKFAAMFGPPFIQEMGSLVYKIPR